MGTQATSGKAYEDRIRNILIGLGENVPPTAGSARGPDIKICREPNDISIEVKSGEAKEGGQFTVPIVDGKLVFNNKILWEGNIPSFLSGDKTKETWLKEKHIFRNDRIELDDRTVIAKYYKDKGSSYIQVEHKGLYHTGEDPLKLGAPLFEADTTLRIRCKQHTSSSVPGSVMASLEFDRVSLKKSPINLEWWKYDNFGRSF